MIDDACNLLRYMAYEIVNITKRIDEKVEKELNYTGRAIYGVPFIFNLKLLFKILGVKYTPPIPKLYVAFYDLVPLHLLEIGVIRGIRYSGIMRKITAEDLLIIKKLQRQKLGASSLFPGMFISYGKFKEEAELSPQLALISLLYANFFKPMSFRHEHAEAILPTPLSLVAYGSRRYMVPAYLLLILDYSKAKERKGRILGEYISYIEARAQPVGFISHDEYTNFRLLSKYRLIVPKVPLMVDEQLYKEYYEKRGRIMAYVRAIIEISEQPLLPSLTHKDLGYGGRGHIIAFNEIPFAPFIFPFALTGTLADAVINFGKKLPSVSINYIELTQEQLHLLETKLARTIDYIRRRESCELGDSLQHTIGSILLNTMREYIHSVQDYVKLYSPSIILALTELSCNPIKILEDLWRLYEETGYERTLYYYENRELIRRLRQTSRFNNIWYTILQQISSFRNNYKLLSLV